MNISSVTQRISGIVHEQKIQDFVRFMLWIPGTFKTCSAVLFLNVNSFSLQIVLFSYLYMSCHIYKQ